MQPDDQFQAASITKMVTAATLMTLVEQGRGKLDAGIRSLSGTFGHLGPARVWRSLVWPEITPWQLLSHTSRVADFFGDGGTGPGGLLPFVARMLEQHGQMWDPLEIVAWTRENLRPALSTGEGWHLEGALVGCTGSRNSPERSVALRAAAIGNSGGLEKCNSTALEDGRGAGCPDGRAARSASSLRFRCW